MSPRTSPSNVRKPVVAYLEHFHQFFSRIISAGVCGSQREDVFVCEFRSRTVFSFSIRYASLADHICNILKSCSQSEVRWIAAISLVDTGMENPLIAWNNLLVFNHPRQLMRLEVVLLAKTSNPNLSIALACACSPNPTFIRTLLFYFGPETILEFIREDLIKQFRKYKLLLHKLVSLICATLSGEPTPRGQFNFNRLV